MDEKIMELLKVIHEDINGIKTDITELKDSQVKIKTDITELKDSQVRIENKLDGVVDQTADLTEFRTNTRKSLDNITNEVQEIKNNLNKVEVVTGKNCLEIEYLKAVK